MIVRAPFIIPEVPIPATARPTMSIAEEFAAPQIREPISNTAKKAIKDHCQRFREGN